MLVFVCFNGSTSRLTASSLGSYGPPHAYSRAHGDGHWHTKSKTCSAGAVKLHASNCTSGPHLRSRSAFICPNYACIYREVRRKETSQPRLSPARSLPQQSPPNPHAPLSNSFVCRDPKRSAQHPLSSLMEENNRKRATCPDGIKAVSLALRAPETCALASRG